jgi:lactate dehydrogenase-like 2-hydroxyacid dehydrogenase
MLSDRVDDELLEAAGPGLRVVANYAVGIDNVDLVAVGRRGVVCSSHRSVGCRSRTCSPAPTSSHCTAG